MRKRSTIDAYFKKKSVPNSKIIAQSSVSNAEISSVEAPKKFKDVNLKKQIFFP